MEMHVRTTLQVGSVVFFSFLLAICLTACNASCNFEKCVESGNYIDAINVYREKISGNSTKELEAKDFVRQYMQDALDNYASGEIDNRQVESAFDCLLKIDDELYILNVELGAGIEQLTDLQMSKENFIMATSAIDAGNYEEALNFFASVAQGDTQNYATAQEQLALAYSTYKTNLIAEVNGLIAKKEFEQANERIEDASDILGNDEEYTALLSSVISTWEEDIIYTASELFGANKDYASAIRFLQLCGLQTNAIDAEITKYQDYVPIYLADLEYTQKTQYLNIGSHSDAITTDLQGTMYDGARLIYPTGGSLASDAASTEDEAYVNYYLGAKYSRLTGVLYVPYKSLSCPGEWKIPTIVKVYGDKALLFEAPAFTVDITEPLSIDIDITGVRELKIVMLGTWTEDTTWVGLYSRQPKVCAADFCISK